ncbi:PaaI family thioesterase [Microbacterium elymi]|uniref:PaaI family thioesterase n=1 Tax=Microbacterium elymi TaxID=2909587 RepID=UPI003F49196E
MTPRRLALIMSLWIPNLCSGIRVRRFADDWTSATVELHVNPITRNYVKTAFGGSMSAMTDPYFFMLVMHQIGRDYVVWDTKGEIEFRKPGRGVLTARFEVPPAKIAELRERAHGGAKVLEWFETDITDAEGDVVAHVRREVYVREKRRVTEARSSARGPIASVARGREPEHPAEVAGQVRLIGVAEFRGDPGQRLVRMLAHPPAAPHLCGRPPVRSARHPGERMLRPPHPA